MRTYKLVNNLLGTPAAVAGTDGEVLFCIPFDPANTDYQEYLKWLEAGGVPLPADTQSE